MFCGLGEEERTKIRKKKKEKKTKKPYRGQKWVGWDERVSWDRFLRQTCGAVFGF